VPEIPAKQTVGVSSNGRQFENRLSAVRLKFSEALPLLGLVSLPILLNLIRGQKARIEIRYIVAQNGPFSNPGEAAKAL